VRSQLSRCTVFVCLLALFVVASPLHAAVVVARSDETMIRMAPAIVTGTVVEVYSRLNDRGDIETVTRILVDETIKGSVPAGKFLDLVQFGGALNGRFEAQSGAPTYKVGGRYLVVLDLNGRGEWTTFDLAMGQFRFVVRDGNQVLVRDTSEIEGWTTSGEPFHDTDRQASPFLAFAREVVRTTPLRAASTALHAGPLAPLDYDLKSVSQSAVPKWHGGASAMNDSVSASAASGDTKDLNDGESRVIADDPHAEIAGTFGGAGVIATAFYGSIGAMSMKNGENYIEIDRQDVVVNDGVSSGTLSSEKFLTAIVHEFGHTWGFRHSNQANGGGFCALPLPCTSTAIMNSTVATGLSGNLQSWDLDAANEVYGDGTRQASFTGSQYVVLLGGFPARRPGSTSWRISQNAATCTAPQITTQPAGSTIASGNQATLTVAASGTATVAFQWYIGNPPSTSNPVPGGNTASIQVSPASTTTYWAQATNSCGSANSNAATVTVNATGCPTVVVGNPTAVDLGNGTFQLSVTASGGSGFSYAWFQGPTVGSGTQVGTGNPFTTGVISTQTSFWVRVTNSCANQTNSPRVVTVGPAQCNPLVIINQPQNQTVLVGGTVQLSVGFIGTTPATVLWYRGTPPDTSNLVGSQQTITSPVINATTTFYAKITNACSTVTTNVVTITATQTCNAPAVTSASATPATAQPGTPITLAVDATGSSLTYQWFRGASGDTSNPISGATSSTFVDTPAAAGTFLYWVKVGSGCGTAVANSNTVTVTITSQCVPPTIAQPTNVEILFGEKATLTVTPLAGSDPLHYSWFQGAKFDTSHPVGTDSPTLVTPSALTQDTQFFVNVSNACGNINSETITVKVNLQRRHAARSK
jgi:Ig-like domain CHU_C associated